MGSDTGFQIFQAMTLKMDNPFSLRRWITAVGGILTMGMMSIVLALIVQVADVRAEYGDVVINNYSETAGMRPVVFPHWFHRIRFRCKVCHGDLDFKFQAGGNEINMVKIIDGQYCGSCHNGELAWGLQDCNLCHSGKPGTKTQVHESTVQKLVLPQLKK